MAEICSDERIALRELIDMLPALRAIVGKQPQPPIEAKPIQPTLIEAVEKYLHYFYDANPASGGINGETFQVAMRSALDRAKKREDLIEEILKSARSISNYDVHSMGIAFPKLCEEFRALDAFDKEGGK